MKMKKIFILLIICLIVFFIYYVTKDNKVYYVSIGDYVSINNNIDYGKKLEREVRYNKKNYRTVDLIDDIESNKEIIYKNKKYKFANMLIKADIIVLSIGMNDLLFYDLVNDNMYVYIDDILMDLDKVLSLVKYYSKEKVYIYNYFGFDDKFLDYANKRLDDLAKEYNVGVIDISRIKNRKKLSDKDYKYIEKELINILKK